MSAPLIPELKRAVARWSLDEARKVADRALEMDSCAAVRHYLASLRQ